MKIEVGLMHFETLNRIIRESSETYIHLENCIGQRYIGSGISGKQIEIVGTPGNALGAYLDGSKICVYGNTQEATGDTMNEGTIIIHGSAGDGTGYAMRGGKIFVKGDAGYRAGIHMKAYKEKAPSLVIGGRAGSFLGEYQAGGTIVVLGLGEQTVPVGNFCGTGMHGGKIYIRSNTPPQNLANQILVEKATEEDLLAIRSLIEEFTTVFEVDEATIYDEPFYVLTPDTKNPYRQLYTHY